MRSERGTKFEYTPKRELPPRPEPEKTERTQQSNRGSLLEEDRMQRPWSSQPCSGIFEAFFGNDDSPPKSSTRSRKRQFVRKGKLSYFAFRTEKQQLWCCAQRSAHSRGLLQVFQNLNGSQPVRSLSIYYFVRNSIFFSSVKYIHWTYSFVRNGEVDFQFRQCLFPYEECTLQLVNYKKKKDI